MWEAWPKNDRLQRWRIVDTSSPGRGKTVIAENIRRKETADQICDLHNGSIHITVTVTEPQPIETAPKDLMLLAHEPMYGWLIVMHSDKGWYQKTSGNFWADVPESVQFTHWLPYPHPPDHPDEFECRMEEVEKSIAKGARKSDHRFKL